MDVPLVNWPQAPAEFARSAGSCVIPYPQIRRGVLTPRPLSVCGEGETCGVQFTTVSRLSVLFAMFGSGKVEIAVTVAPTAPAASGRTTMVMVAVALGPIAVSLPTVQVTVVLTRTHLPMLELVRRKATLLGAAKVSTTPLAGVGPLFVRVMV